MGKSANGQPENDLAAVDKTEEVLVHFLREIRKRLGAHLEQVVLFGSRARGDAVSESDYDCLLVVDEVSSQMKEAVYEVTGEILYQYSAVFSAFPILAEKYRQQKYNPLLMNIRKEGISLWTRN